MIRRLSFLVWFLAIALLAGTQYHVSYRVQSLGRELRQIKAETLSVEENIRILEAEWAYVNNPDRLRELAGKYLTLAPLKGHQIVHFGDIPLSEPLLASLASHREGI
ncbi:MAG: hypothetical protein A2018_07950 [Alphaproteobacteria bacterium GWF2_58_20]|nr:MAG: hypothetical protein A2018_07950 [Alphaproteobacteria bacterium GWF2_58_20]